MDKLVYLMSQHNIRPLVFGRQYDHNDLIVEIQGFTRVSDNSTVYLKIGSPVEALVPLDENFQFTIQSYITKQAEEKIPCQLVEYKLVEGSTTEYELISNSDIFFGTVLPSLDESEIPEITDPSLDLIYTQVHEMYLTIKSAYESGEFKGEKGDKGDKGDKPIKGTDYWTENDQNELADAAKEKVQPLLDEEIDRAIGVENLLQDIIYNESTIRSESDNKKIGYHEVVNNVLSSYADNTKEILISESELPVAPVQDVQIEGSSIVENGVAKIPRAYTQKYGVVATYQPFGIGFANNGGEDIYLCTVYAQKSTIDGRFGWKPITPAFIDYAVKCALCDGKGIAYTDDEKLAAQERFGINDLIDSEATTREEADKALEAKISDTDSKKVGYQEVQGNTLYMYSDDTKAVLLATLELPAAPVQDVQIEGSSIVTDGVATIPCGNDSTAGVIKPVYGYGLQTNNNYQLYGVSRSAADYKTLNTSYIISKGTLTNIQQSYVDEILCSTNEAKALTTEQQIAARERIGATTKSGWTKVATVTDPNGGDILNLEGYDELYIYGNLVTSNLSWLYFQTLDNVRVTQIYNDITGVDSNKTLFVRLFNTPLGVDVECKYYRAINSTVGGILSTAYASAKNLTVADIAKIVFQYPNYVTTLSLDVYAK